MNEDRVERDSGALLQALREARGDCPPAERLLDWAAGRLDGAAAKPIGEHVVLCSLCAEAVLRANEAGVEVDELGWRRTAARLDARQAPWRPARLRGRPAWYVAAAAAVAVFAILIVYRPAPEFTSTPSPAAVVRDAEINLIEPVGAVTDLAALRWSGLPAPVRYRVEVAGRTDTIWTRVTSETRIRPDEALVARLAPGQAFRWRVVVLDAEGQELSRSEWVGFELVD
jgi:hypothetical protein